MPATLAALIALAALACAQCGAQGTAPRARTIKLPWRIYRHFPADFSRWDEAAAGFKGWDSELRELDLSRTCLVLMHFPSTGLTPDTEWGPDCPVPDALGTIEWVPRAMDVVCFRMPRLVQAARAAGLQIVHITGGDGTGPIWEQCLQEVGPPPPPDPDTIPRDEAAFTQHTRDVFELPSKEPPGKFGTPDLAFPSSAAALVPQQGDLVASQSWQLARLLKNRGINHIVYCGWALNWCLWFSPGGMCDMSRKGFLCSAVRGGCVAIENRESAVGEGNLEYALWKTSTMFGYVFELHELTHALREAAAPKP